jgi:hypothetical protein
VIQNFIKWPMSTLGMQLAEKIGEKWGFRVAIAGAQVVGNLIGVGVGLLVGSPIGYSPQWSPVGGSGWGTAAQPGTWTGKGHDAAQEAVDEYYTNKGESPFIGQ